MSNAQKMERNVSSSKRYRVALTVLLSGLSGAAWGCSTNDSAGPPAPDAPDPKAPDDTPAPDEQAVDGTIAIVDVVDGKPALSIKRGSASPERFHFVGATEFPGNPGIAPAVEDANITALGPLRFSPDGSRLAVVVNTGADISEVVVIDLATNSAEEASFDLQIITGGLAWSSDGGSIAYVMSTEPSAIRNEIFVTDLGSRTSRQVTQTSSPDFALAELRFGDGDRRLFASRFSGFGQSGNMQLVTVDLASAVVQTAGPALTASAASIGPNGEWLVLARASASGIELVRHTLASGAEAVLVGAAEKPLYADVLDDAQVLVATEAGTKRRYFLTAATGGAMRAIPSADSVSLASIHP